MSFLKKKRVKVQFDFVFDRVEWRFGYSKLAGKTFHLEWKKNDKENGKSKALVLESGADSIKFDFKVKFAATIDYSGDISKSPKFKSKKVLFTLAADDEKDKGEAVAGKVEFDLASVAQVGKVEQDIVLLEWLKMDGKKIVAADPDAKKKKSDEDDILGDLGDLGKEVSALAKKKKDAKKGKKTSELDLLEDSESGRKIEINGVEHDLVETDELSEIEESYNPENTDRDYLTDSDDLEEDPFEAEERKEKEEAKRLERRASRRMSSAKLSSEDLESSESKSKSKKDKDKKKSDDNLEESDSSSRSRRHSRKSSAVDESTKSKVDEEASKKEEEEKARQLKKELEKAKKEEEEKALRKKQEEDEKLKKQKEEDEKLKKQKEADAKKKKEEEELQRKKEEEEKKKKEDEKKKADEAAKKKAEEEEKKKKELEAKQKAEEEAKKKKEEEEKKKKLEEEKKSMSSPAATSDAAAKRSSIAERTAKWNNMITNPGGKPKEPEPAPKVEQQEPKKDIKKELEAVLANPGGKPKPASEEKKQETDQPSEKLQFPTADRPKGPQGRRPSQRHLSRGNSLADDSATVESPALPEPKPETKPETKEPASDSKTSKASPAMGSKASPSTTSKADSISSKESEELSKVKSQLADAQSETKKLKQKLEEAEEEMSEAVSKKEETISELKKKIKELEEDIDDLEDQLDQARGGAKPSPSDESTREIKKLKDQISDLEEKLKKSQDDVAGLKKELSAAKAAASAAAAAAAAASDAAKKSKDSDDETNYKSKSGPVSGDAAETISSLQKQLENRAKIIELLYNTRWSYEPAAALEGTPRKGGSSMLFQPSRPAFELGQYLLDQKALDPKKQHDAANQQILKEVLVGLHSQYKRASDQSDVSSQIGWLAHSTSLMWTLLRTGVLSEVIVGAEDESDNESESDDDEDDEDESDISDSGNEDSEESDGSNESDQSDDDESNGRKLKKLTKKPKIEKPKRAKIPSHSLFWARYVAERGIHCGYDDIKECLEDLKGVDVEEELAVDDEDGPARRFLDVLDMLISHQYSLLVDSIQKRIGADKLNDVFFDQSAVLQAAIAPRKREGAHQRLHSPTIITGQLEQIVQLLRKTHPFAKALELQLVAQIMEWMSRHLTNALFSGPHLCRAGTAYSLKVALSHVEQWFAGVVSTANADSAMTNWVNERLEPLREAANILLLDKSVFAGDLTGIFVALTLPQINKIVSQFAPDDFAPDRVPEDTLRTLQKAVNSLPDAKKKSINFTVSKLTLLPKFE